MKDLKKSIFTLNLGAIFITYDYFLKELAKEDVQKKYGTVQIKKAEETLNKAQSYSEEISKVMDSISDNKIVSQETLNSFKHHIDSIAKIQNNQKSLSNEMNNILTEKAEVMANDSIVGSITTDEQVKSAFKLTKEMEQNLTSSEEHLKGLNELLSKISGSDSNNFTESITQLILEFQDIISSFSLIQKLTLINMLTGALILNCLITLIIVFYGESLINYFDLVNKYPRLTKFIKLRSKFQQFYFFVNSIIIFIEIVAMVYVNYLMFILAN